MSTESEYVLICVAWPYANGPLHLGHVAGCYLPPDIQARYERALGNRVLMVSGSDEHGTPITVTAEQEGVEPQEIVNKFHEINSKALLDLGCSWSQASTHEALSMAVPCLIALVMSDTRLLSRKTLANFLMLDYLKERLLSSITKSIRKGR